MNVNHLFTYSINRDDNETSLGRIVHIQTPPYLFKIIFIPTLLKKIKSRELISAKS